MTPVIAKHHIRSAPFVGCEFNPDNPLGHHSGEGRNPFIKNTLQSRQNHVVVPLAREISNHLDTGLRRYDAVLANGLAAFNRQIEVNHLNYFSGRELKSAPICSIFFKKPCA